MLYQMLPLRIARDVVGGELEPRQLVFGDDDARRASLRPRQRDERRVLRSPARARVASHFTSFALVRVVEAAGRAAC